MENAQRNIAETLVFSAKISIFSLNLRKISSGSMALERPIINMHNG